MSGLAVAPYLSDAHRAYLHDHAVADAVIDAQGIRSDGDDIVFTWREGEHVTEQRRPWPGESGQYYWTAGADLHLNVIRDPGPDAPVLLCEGTKQSLAVASWAPSQYAVMGMPGCYGWTMSRHLDLARFAGRTVLVLLDADAAENLDVYEAGARLASELEMEDPPARVAFIPSPMWGTAGIDDYLSRIAGGRRGDRLAKLIEKAQGKPADRKPARRKRPVPDTAQPDTAGRPMVVVNKDRMTVISEILATMLDRWGGRELFCYGGVLARLRGDRTEPLDKDSFAAWLAEGMYTCKYFPPTLMQPGRYEPDWPDQQTMGAVLSLGDRFAELRRVARVPFFRDDGTACFKNGYDWATGTMLACGNSGMDRLDIPESPSQADAAQAASFLLDEWLGDMAFRTRASRASALALVLTPFIRGLVPLVPLAVVSGLQPGVGKGLFGDCVSIMATGHAGIPLPYVTDDEDEIRKQITAAFRQGTDLFCFDEAHVLGGSALARALTSITYTDRILGVSKMAEFPNQVTWMSLGNQVEVNADMARRVYWIELYPGAPDPENRPETSFAHPDLREWTLANRPELVTAALTVIRAWFAAGQPKHSRGALMGSFEKWDRMMSGILAYAGVPGFLEGLDKRRRDADASGGWWADHVAWLYRVFGANTFTAGDVRTRALALSGQWDAPPGLDEVNKPGYARELGKAYGRIQERWFSGLRLLLAGKGHDNINKWIIQPYTGGTEQQTPPDLGGGYPGGNNGGITRALPGTGGVQDSFLLGTGGSLVHSMPPDLGGGHPGGNNGGITRALPGTGGVHNDTGGVQEEHTLSDLAFPEAPPAVGRVGTPLPAEMAWGVSGVSTSPSCARDARAHDIRARDARIAHTRGQADPRDTPDTPRASFAFDLETASADELFTYTERDETGYVRLAGIIGPKGDPVICDSPRDLLAMLEVAPEITGHNILGFDLLALARHHGADYGRLARKALDTELIARQASPPRSRDTHSADSYGLDDVARRLGVPGKTDDARRLKARYGGWDKIPLEDPEYRAYLEGDLRASAAVITAMRQRHYLNDPYIAREHRLAALAGRMTLSGFRVDTELLSERLRASEGLKADVLGLLHTGWDLPLTKTVTRGRGTAKAEHEEPVKSPLATDAGRAWLAAQYERYGISNPPRTAKAGKLALGAEDLKPLLADPRCTGSFRQMLVLMGIVTTTRTVYQTASDCLTAGGRVHPSNSFRQASGRWSVTNPGLTVFGKRGGKHVERDIFLPDEGHVLLSFDLSQVDMRAMAGHCQDPAYMALFAPGRDAHAEIAAQVGIARQDAKAIGHGWNYGLGADAMIKGGPGRPPLDEGLVRAFIAGMEDRFPGLIAWREQVRDQGRAGEILYNGFGRRMACDPARAYTVAPALMGQGGARDIMSECLLNLDESLWPLLRVMVHDEIVLSVPKPDEQEVTRMVTQAMTWEWRGVPILCDRARGLNWGAASAK